MEDCKHHWDIEPAAGRSSSGVCRHCGARRQFLNSIQEPGLVAKDDISCETQRQRKENAADERAARIVTEESHGQGYVRRLARGR